MKRILSFCTFSLSALASSYTQAYSQADYAKAFSEAMAACEINCDSIELNLIIAKSAQKIGNTHEALAAYDRVLIYDEQNIEAHFAMAQIYASKGNLELLQAELDALQANPNLNAAQRAKIEQIKKIGKESAQDGQIRPYNLSFSAGIGYDSNPKRENSKRYSIYFDNEEYIAQNSKSSGAASFIASVYGSYEFKLNEKFAIELNANVYHKNYFKSSSLQYPNIDVLGFNVVPKFYINDSSLATFNAGYDYVVLKNHGFLHSPHFGLDLYTNLSSRYYLSMGYSLTKGIFVKSYDKDDNYYHHNVYTGLNIAINDQMLGFSISADSEKASKSLSYYSDYDALALSLSYFLPINESFELNNMAGISFSKYKKYSPLYLSKRKDKDYFISSEFTYKINRLNSLGLNLGYTITKSNQAANDSDNFNVTLMYRYSF